jgi:nucleoside-diphosphate-sugar epimerase
MEKVLVTGPAGYLGSGLVSRLLERGFRVIGVDALLYGGESMLSFYSHPLFRFEKLDITKETLPDEEVDFVVHLAALVGPVCDRDPQPAWSTNYEATVKVGEWAQQHGARLVFASTCSNYGIHEGLATENSPLKPLGVYAETKVKSEQQVARLGSLAVTLRFGTLAGLTPRPRFDLLINQWIWEAHTNGKIECYLPEAQRPFLHALDAAEAIVRLLTCWDQARHPVYNVVGFNTTKRDLAAVVSKYTDCQVVEPASANDRRDYAVSAELIREDLGYQPRFSMDECVKEVFTAVKLGVVRPRKEFYNA